MSVIEAKSEQKLVDEAYAKLTYHLDNTPGKDHPSYFNGKIWIVDVEKLGFDKKISSGHFDLLKALAEKDNKQSHHVEVWLKSYWATHLYVAIYDDKWDKMTKFEEDIEATQTVIKAEDSGADS